MTTTLAEAIGAHLVTLRARPSGAGRVLHLASCWCWRAAR